MDHERCFLQHVFLRCDGLDIPVFGGAVGYEFSILEVSTRFYIIHKKIKLVSLPWSDVVINVITDVTMFTVNTAVWLEPHIALSFLYLFQQNNSIPQDDRKCFDIITVSCCWDAAGEKFSHDEVVVAQQHRTFLWCRSPQREIFKQTGGGQRRTWLTVQSEEPLVSGSRSIHSEQFLSLISWWWTAWYSIFHYKTSFSQRMPASHQAGVWKTRC